MPGPFPSGQYRAAKKARASASPSKPSSSPLLSSSSRLGVAVGSSSNTTQAQAQAVPGSSNISRSASKPKSSSSNPLLKSLAKKDAANALKKAKLLSKSHSSKPHSSFKPSSSSSKVRGLNLNTSINLDSAIADADLNIGVVSKPNTEPPARTHHVDVKAIEELTEKSRQAAIKRFAQEDERDKARKKEKDKERERQKDEEKVKAMPAMSSSSTHPNATSGSSSSSSNATLTAIPNARQTATASSSRQQAPPAQSSSNSNSTSAEDRVRTTYTQPAGTAPIGAQVPMYPPSGLHPYPQVPAVGGTFAYPFPPPAPPGIPSFPQAPLPAFTFATGNGSGSRRASAPTAVRGVSQQGAFNTFGAGSTSQRSPIDPPPQRSPVDPPTVRSGTPSAPSHPQQAAPVQQAGVVSADFLNAMYSAQDVTYGRLGAVQNQVVSLLAIQDAHGRGLHGVQGHLQTVQGSVQSLLNVEAEDRRERGKGFDTLVAAVQEIKEGQEKAKEEQRIFFESQVKLLGGLVTNVSELRKELKDLRESVGEPSEKGDGRSLFARLHGMEYMLGEVAELVEDRGANVPEGSTSSPPQPTTAQQPEAGPSTVRLQLNTRDEPIEIDLDDSPSGTVQAGVVSQPVVQVQQAGKPQGEQPLVHASTSTGNSSSRAPDFHTFLLNTQGGQPSASGAHSPATTTNFDNDTDVDLDLEYPFDSSQLQPLASRSQSQARKENINDEERQGVERSAKTPEPNSARPAFVAKTPTQSSGFPPSMSTATAFAASSSTTTIVSSTSTATLSSANSGASTGCTLDKSTLHFSPVDWSSSKEAASAPPTADFQPYTPDPQSLSKTPIAQRVSSTLPPPPAGSIAELRLGVVGCAPYVGSGLIVDQNDRLAVQEEKNGEAKQSVVVPVVTRPSVSPLPSPETTPSASREGTPVPAEKRDREASVKTAILSDDSSQQPEQEDMLVDEGVVREDGMEVDTSTREDTLDTLAANLREVRSLEEEKKRIEAEIEAARVEVEAKEKAAREAKEEVEREAREKAERDEAERQRKEEEAEENARMERVEAEMRAKRLERLEREREKEKKRAEEEEREAKRVKAEAARMEQEAERAKAEEARKKREEKERKEREKVASELAEAQERERHRIEEENWKEKERQEREVRAKARKEEEDRERAVRNKEAFEREEKERMQEIERQARAHLEAEREKEKVREAEREEKEKEVAQEEEPDLGQQQPDQDYQQDYDLNLEIEPGSGIDPVYTQLGGPTPARSQFASSSSSPTLRRRLAPSATEIEIAKDLLSPEVEAAGGLMSPEMEIPKDIDDPVDTSDEGEHDELHDELEEDDLDSSPLVRPTSPSSLIFHSTPRKDQTPASSSTGETKKAPAKLTQNRTVTYTPKAFKGARSQPLLEIVTNSPSQLTREAQKDENGKRRVGSESVPESPTHANNEGEGSEGEVNDILPPPPTSSPFVYPDDEAGGTKIVTVSAGDDALPGHLNAEDMYQDEPALRESPEEQLFLPGDDDSRSHTPQSFRPSHELGLFDGYSDDDEPPLPPPRLKSSWSKSTARSPSEEVPEATSTPKSKVSASKPTPSTITKAASTSSSSNAQGLLKTPTRSRTSASNSISTPVPLSTGSGLGGRMNSHPASKTLVPTPSRKGALSRRFEEENRSRERSNPISTSVAPGKKSTVALLPSTLKVKPTVPVSGSTTTARAEKTPAANDVIEILSSPEVSPRTTAQNVIAKRKKKLDAKDKSKLKDGDDDVKRESLGGKTKARVSRGSASKANTSNIFIDLTSDKEEEDDGKQRGSGGKTKGKAKESAKAAEPEGKEDDSKSDSDSDPDLGVDTDDSAEIVAAVPVRRNLAQSTRPGSTQSQQPLRLITDRLKNKSGQSAAATRVKRPSDNLKRANDGDSDDDRPLKRARERSASRGGFVPVIGTVKTRPKTSVTQSVASGSKRKERERDADEGVAVKKEKLSRATGARESSTSTVASSSRTRDSGNAKTLRARTVDLEAEPVKWPAANKHGNRNFQRDFIECDKCNGWYHYGCVGIKDEDPRIRLQDPESFMCPKCEMGFVPATRTKEEKERCGRPNCIQRAPRSNEYYVERLVGRKFSGMAASYWWLVKWDGYPLEQSTWQTEKDMTEPMKLIEAFTEVAQDEGKILSNPYKKILLKEVEESGWVDPDIL